MDFIVGGIILLILGSAAGYLWKQKKLGNHCVGCGSASSCASCGSGCQGDSHES